MLLTLFQRYKFLDVGLSTVIFFVLVGTILSKLKRYEDETSKLYTFSDSFSPDGCSWGLEEKFDPGGLFYVVWASFSSLQTVTKKIAAIKTAKLLDGKTFIMSSYVLFKLWVFQREFLRNYNRYIGLKFSEVTEIAILFQYLKISFLLTIIHQIMISLC